MKQYISTTLIALAAALYFSQAAATGLTYDPCENYYSEHYGMESIYNPASVDTSSVQDNTDVLDPYDGYYTYYYGIGADMNSESASLAMTATDSGMADPNNYYQW